jgi:signal transduction histidine kinase
LFESCLQRSLLQKVIRSTKSFGKLNEKQHKAITVILNGITKLDGLIGDILDVYKLDIGKKLKQIDVNVEKLVNRIVTDLFLTNTKLNLTQICIRRVLSSAIKE